MSDLTEAFDALMKLPLKDIEKAIITIKDITARNQNPGCGGDGSMSAQQWVLLQEIQENLLKLVQKMLRCATDTNPKICDSKLWKLENNKKD